LARAEAAGAALASPAAGAFVARIAAIGGIADPLAPVDVTAALAAGFAVDQPGQYAARSALAAARLTVGPAVVAAPVPDNGFGQAEAALSAGTALAREATAAAAGGQRDNNQGEKPASHHGENPKGGPRSIRLGYRPAKSAQSRNLP